MSHSTGLWIVSTVFAMLFGLSTSAMAEPADPASGFDDTRGLTNAEMLAKKGFTADDAGLRTAAADARGGTRTLAYLTAYDLDTGILIEPALREIETVEQSSVWTNFAAAQYLDQQGRAEGADYLRHLASVPMEQVRHSPEILRVMDAIRILAKKGDESFAPQITACLEEALPAEAVAAAQALAAFQSSSHPEVEAAWLAAAERLSTLAQSDDPNDQSGAWLYATWLDASVRKQTIVTQRIKDAFDAVSLPVNRGEELARVAASLDSVKAHWATCELAPSEEPPPADPPPADPE